MRAMRISNPQMRAIADQMEQDEVVRWASCLSRARVTRWGGMISTPDAMLQVCTCSCFSFSSLSQGGKLIFSSLIVSIYIVWCCVSMHILLRCLSLARL